ncbi:Inositol 2-dehydrogenase/D-chiro-inositol 3-dehydrogenase [Dyadobacter sp. CECT 9275]|uniref:Inositol 2-dehydrogenase/D-chiro-inositol 3-dehydrogenase n=1 Tax=Dyadobacter helix TaxID=2822344 RepID=A0A916J8D4_9BACT|nr:Gfo/Idh/MocA family oxidoreductase [Dyadobacter sp. CECT 9275]CAG4989815.1 Inositol 2-dehydrogenase/D-chiro-inositol 3-dehydrogenase [Dyadobacter sp. CECT 9275]
MKKIIETDLLPSRRSFIKHSSLALGGALLSPGAERVFVNNSNNDVIRIALIGCGKRGAGAAAQALTASKNVRLVALADVFRDQLDETFFHLSKIEKLKGQIDVPENHKFVGFDAYKKAIELADVVLLATPAPFRPDHFEAAIAASKHVFMEKPLASDAPGIRKILATGELATRKKLSVVVGLQNRYDPTHQEFVNLIKEGAIGDVLSANCYYMVGNINLVPRKPGWTEMEYQVRNWRYFNWLWAGSPAGLQIHNDDVVNWVKNGYPVRAQGVGGRSAFKGPDNGDVYDHFYVEYEYADGFKLHSEIRHIDGTMKKNGFSFLGTKGYGDLATGLKEHNGKVIWKKNDRIIHNPYQIEHDKLFESITTGKLINDTEWGAKSTMACIIGRMAAHSGQTIEWDEAMQSNVSIVPEKLAWDANPLVMPDQNGNYPVPVAGVATV